MTLALNQIWRYRKLLNMLAQSRGAGTSCITLILPPRKCLWHSAPTLPFQYRGGFRKAQSLIYISIQGRKSLNGAVC